MRIGTKAERVNVRFYLLQICGGIHQDVVEGKILLQLKVVRAFKTKGFSCTNLSYIDH